MQYLCKLGVNVMYKKTKAQVISDAFCGILMLLSILAYVLIGLFAKLWHPTWIIIICAMVACGVITICVNTYAGLHKEDEKKEAEEPAKATSTEKVASTTKSTKTAKKD